MTHTRLHTSLLVLTMMTLAACKTQVEVSVRGLEGGPTMKWDALAGHMEVLYATDRSVSTSREGKPRYGLTRGELARGACDVTIPSSHRIGDYAQTPGDDPTQFTLVRDVAAMDAASFKTRLSEALDAPTRDGSGEAGGRDRAVLIFVHGFYNTFDDAVRRTAQLAYDIGVDVVPICYTWPSAADLSMYTVDGNNVDWSVPHFMSFLKEVRAAAGTRPIHIIAHSMGAGIVTRALRRLSFSLGPAAQPIVDHLIMAAPDIDRDVFVTDLVTHVRRLCKRVTVYTAAQDAAMQISRTIHGYPRLGEKGTADESIAGIDVIDATLVNETLVGHLYYGDSRPVIVDMFLLIRHNLPPAERLLLSRGEGEQRHWVLRP